MLTLDQKAWNNFVLSAPDSTFLHSWEWGQLQQQLGIAYWRLVIEDASSISAVALVIKRLLPWGKSWLYVPRGPVFAPHTDHRQAQEKLAQKLQELAQEQRALFLRLDPAWPASRAQELTSRGWVKAEREVQPRDTSVVDLTKSEDALLQGMHHKTRYNIKVAQKHEVQTRFTTDAAAVQTFLTLARDVHGRANFHFHPDDYYQAMHAVLAPAGMLEVGLAEHATTPLAAHLLISFGDTTTYAHGASSSQERQRMAPHLLQWESIKRAKAAGYSRYDFFGVAPPFAEATGGKPAHPWSGITRFKEGFGGQREAYIGTYDYIIDRVGYTGFTLARRLRKLWR